MTDLSRVVDDGHLFGRRGFQGLDWHARTLLRDVEVSGGHALEIGAGDGLLSLWLLNAGAASVTSLEPEAAGATHGVGARAAELRRALGLDHAMWRYLPATFQDFEPDRAFRVVLSKSSVNHLDEEACMHLLDDAGARATYIALFRKVRALLEPGGSFVLADCGRANYWASLGRKSPWAPQIEWHKHHEPETWADVLSDAGLALVSTRWWHPYYGARALEPILDNRFVARCLSSYWVMRAVRR